MKPLGILLTLLSIGAIGLLHGRTLREQVANGRWLAALLARLEGEIRSLRMPLDEIYRAFAQSCGEGDRERCERLCALGLGGVLKEMGARALPSGCYEGLCEMAGRLGMEEGDESLARLQRERTALERALSEQVEQLPSRLRVNRTLTVCAALMAVILFL